MKDNDALSFCHLTVTDTKLLADRIEDALPQTQCTKCGYAGCRPYAEAIAAGAAEINQCPPGGAEGIARLSSVTGRKVIPLNPVNGFERPRAVAFIDEALCIGCTLCIQACPVDAILGAAKQMHTIVPEPVHRLRPVRGALPGRLHRHVSGDRNHGLGRVERGLRPTPRARATTSAPRACSASAKKTMPAWPPRRRQRWRPSTA
jgi:NAD-dependent dihydropyrimidine dehydrogenase PreA subunit